MRVPSDQLCISGVSIRTLGSKSWVSQQIAIGMQFYTESTIVTFPLREQNSCAPSKVETGGHQNLVFGKSHAVLTCHHCWSVWCTSCSRFQGIWRNWTIFYPKLWILSLPLILGHEHRFQFFRVRRNSRKRNLMTWNMKDEEYCVAQSTVSLVTPHILLNTFNWSFFWDH